MKSTLIRKTIIVLFVLFGISTTTNAQDLKVKWGMESDGGDKKSINEPMGWYEGNYYNLRLDYIIMANKYSVFIEKINADMKVMSIKEVAYESSPTINFEYSRFIDGKIYIFSSQFDGKTDKLKVFYDAFDVNGKKVGGKDLASFALRGRMAYQPMQFSLSPDKKTICGVFSESSKKEEPLKFNVISIPTANIDAASTSSQKIVYSGDEIGILRQQIDNKGNVFLLVNKKRDKKDDPEVTLYIVDNTGKLSKEQKLEYQNYILGNVDMIAAEDGTIKFAGIYFDKVNKKTFYKGFFLGTFNPENFTFSKFSTVAFDSKALSFYGKRAEKKGEASIGGQFMTKIYPAENGKGGFIVAENLSVVHGSMVSYNFYELLVINYNDDEELGKMNFIPKYQYDAYRPPSTMGVTFAVPYGFRKLMEIYTSYSAFVNDGNLYIMFNDDEKNTEAKSMDDVKAMTAPNKAVTMLFTISDDGVKKKKVWFNNKEKDGFFTPSKTYSEGDIKVIGISEKKNMRYGKLSFNRI